MAGTIDRARGALLGLAVGDALGGPLEFLSADQIHARYGRPVDGYVGGGWLSLAPGQGTDDTAMAMALARSAATSTGYHPGRALAAYLEWFRTNPPDVGHTIRAALAGAEAGMSTVAVTEAFHRKAGRSAGNGSLMRVAPIALRHLIAAERRAVAARVDSKLTHFDDHAAAACAWLCDALAALVEGIDGSELLPPPDLEPEWNISPDDAARSAGGPAAGYVGTALGVAAAAVRTASSLEEGLVWAVNLGGDTDTNGAVAGALLGARFGASAIPPRWLDRLAVRDEAGRLAERLVALAQADAGGQTPRRGHSVVPGDPCVRLTAALEPYVGSRDDPEALVAAEAAIAASGAFREGPMFVSHVPERDVLYVLERGYVDDGLEPERQVEICGDVSLVLDLDGEACVGFIFGTLSEFDFDAPENAVVWSGPRFDIPALGIELGTIGLIAATARLVLVELRTPDGVRFDAALGRGLRGGALAVAGLPGRGQRARALRARLHAPRP
jgi:ADP-ribosyl-[dinitrogen reductase] hydrolase